MLDGQGFLGYPAYMMTRTIRMVTIDHKTGNGRYSDVLDVAERLSVTYGSPTNAIAVMVRDSDLFKQAMSELRSQDDAQPAKAAS